MCAIFLWFALLYINLFNLFDLHCCSRSSTPVLSRCPNDTKTYKLYGREIARKEMANVVSFVVLGTSLQAKDQTCFYKNKALRLQSSPTDGVIGSGSSTSYIRSCSQHYRDSYHYKPAAQAESKQSLPTRLFHNRGQLRYDPYSRRYVEWGHTNDWNHTGINSNGNYVIPRFTEEERRIISPSLRKNRSVNPFNMGKEWNNIGPKV